MDPQRRPIIITAPECLVPFLRQEIAALGFQTAWTGDTAVGVRGTFTDALRLNLWLRTAHHVLFQIAEFQCRDLDGLYRSVSSLAWEGLLPADGFVSVESSVNHPSIRDHRIVNMKCKDAIVDRIAAHKGKRPDSGARRDRTVISVFWNEERCGISIDTSGEPLSKRGYRRIPLQAPMQETLAAGVVLATGYDPRRDHFINPMCGSGTLAIEAALIAAGRAPGLTRNNFGFMHTLLFNRAAWERMIEDARKKCRTAGAAVRKIVACDNDAAAVRAAQCNAVAAGVGDDIEFTIAEFENMAVPAGEGVVVTNPEYGIRLGDEERLVGTYRSIGSFMKHRCTGYRGYVFTGNSKLAGKIGLKSGRKIRFQNGKIDCRLYEYRLFEGKA